MLRRLKPVLICAALSLTPVFMLGFSLGLPPVSQARFLYELLYFGPYVLFALAALLGLWLNQTRILVVALTLLLSYALFAQSTLFVMSGMSRPLLAKGLALALPLSLLCTYALPERRLASLGSGLRILLVLAPMALIYLLFNWQLKFMGSVLGLRFLHYLFPTSSWALPDLAVVAALVFFTLTARIKDFYIRHFNLAVFFGLIPVFFALNTVAGSIRLSLGHPHVLGICYTAAGLLLMVAVFRLYWQKVYMDELTGVSNRRALDEELRTISGLYTAVMCDIDHFKKFNDQYGHEAGDQVLRYVAAILDKDSIGKAFRYGGEEFCLVYPGKYAKEASAFADRLRSELARREFKIRAPKPVRKRTSWKDRGRRAFKGRKVRVTISMGVADTSKGSSTSEGVIQRADQALYKAKNKGRNRVEVY